MNWYIAKRWLLFFVFGMPIQLLIYLLWVIVLPYYLWSRKKLVGDAPKVPPMKWTIKKLLQKGEVDKLRDRYFLWYNTDDPGRQDDHAALVHGYAWSLRTELGYNGIHALVDSDHHTLFRRFPINSGVPVSGDCLASWTAACMYRFSRGLSLPKDRIKTVLDSYIRNCMGLPAENLGWKVSNRSSNSGMNYAPDSWKSINQPCLGAQYFTSAGLLKLGARMFGGWYWLVYFLHYWLLGGWLWTLLPFYHTHKDHIYYAQHVTNLGVYSVAKDSKNPLYKWTQWWMTHFMSPRGFANPLFECYRADCDNASYNDVEDALEKCERFKHVWPQVWPGWIDWYREDGRWHPLTGHLYGVTAGAAWMLLEAGARMQPGGEYANIVFDHNILQHRSRFK